MKKVKAIDIFLFKDYYFFIYFVRYIHTKNNINNNTKNIYNAI